MDAKTIEMYLVMHLRAQDANELYYKLSPLLKETWEAHEPNPKIPEWCFRVFFNGKTGVSISVPPDATCPFRAVELALVDNGQLCYCAQLGYSDIKRFPPVFSTDIEHVIFSELERLEALLPESKKWRDVEGYSKLIY